MNETQKKIIEEYEEKISTYSVYELQDEFDLLDSYEDLWEERAKAIEEQIDCLKSICKYCSGSGCRLCLE